MDGDAGRGNPNHSVKHRAEWSSQRQIWAANLMDAVIKILRRNMTLRHWYSDLS